MSLARRLLLLGALVIVAVVLWLTLHGGSDGPDGPETISKVAGWLSGEGECPEGVDLEASRIPVGPHGPPGTLFREFGELPEAGALAACTGTLGGSSDGSASRVSGRWTEPCDAIRRSPSTTRPARVAANY
jgi:hypothetical protein